jgi:nucleoside 2-deoxyribosyltransferase
LVKNYKKGKAMKKIYFAGKFNKIKQPNISLENSLQNDFRSKLLGSSKLLTHHQDKLIINNSFQYAGPFYCEKASNGNFTSTDCKEILNAEYNLIKNSDTLIAVFSETFSPGTIVELGWALNQNKQIIILYQEEASCYDIKSEYWFAIADAIKRSNNLTILKYNDYSEIVPLINQTIKEEL